MQAYLFVHFREKTTPDGELLRADEITGPYTRIPAFDKSMEAIEEGKYEAATAVKLEDGRWYLFLDYYGVPGAGRAMCRLSQTALQAERLSEVTPHFHSRMASSTEPF